MNRIGQWWNANGLALVGGMLVVLAAGLIVFAVQSYSFQTVTKRQAHASCERSKVFGPQLAKAYAKYHILSDVSPGPGVLSPLAAYAASIPKTCK